MKQRTVTEQDFRAPEFVGKDVADYEFRPDGKLVRKDRWEQGVRAVAQVLGFESREGFEIDDVVRQVAELMAGRAVVTPAPIMDADWIDWNGGECPVNPDVEVAVALRNDTESTGRASVFTWGHGWGAHDIIQYRVIDTDWIDWAGGGCPVDDDMVEIRLRNGLLRKADPASLRWTHSDTGAGGSDIVAYRLC